MVVLVVWSLYKEPNIWVFYAPPRSWLPYPFIGHHGGGIYMGSGCFQDACAALLVPRALLIYYFWSFSLEFFLVLFQASKLFCFVW